MKKQISMLLLAGMCTTMLLSCGNKKTDDNIIVHKSEAKKAKGTQKVGDYEQTRSIEWGAVSYNVTVKRFFDPSLPTVVDEDTGDRYYDNKITVRILRKDGSEFFNRTFSKSDFISCVGESYRKKGVLLGIVYDCTDANSMYFAASVGSPNKLSDEYVPILIKLSRTGAVSITKDTELDTSSDAPQKATTESSDEEDGV